MHHPLTITLAQLNLSVGDIEGNRARILQIAKEQHGLSDLIVFSELSITGYPPDDLILRPQFVLDAMESVETIAKSTLNGPALLVGSPWQIDGKLYNAAVLLADGNIKDMTLKTELPNYGVFDEKRHFTAYSDPRPIDFKGIKLGVMICEDMWYESVPLSLAKHGAQIFISLNASPFEANKHSRRLATARKWTHKTKLPFIYVNQLCGQDELVFDGGSFVLDEQAELVMELHDFKERVESLRFTKHGHHWDIETGRITSSADTYANIYHALTLGLSDYVNKNRFNGVIIGMSGGIDSALTAAIAVDALGSERVSLFMLPSPYTSAESIEDASLCSELLGTTIRSIPINNLMQEYTRALHPFFKDRTPDTTEENLQSRIRASLLMAMSNATGAMLVTTGNKSEMAVGYATLYGDMCGGFNALKDIYKTDVYALCKWRNNQSVVIPERILTKAPTAELRNNQTDQDSLPPYDLLDAILASLIEDRISTTQLIAQGYDSDTVKKVARLIKIAEYKRRQSPPGIKITRLAFGRDRRYPITNGFDF
jgi:NAD+ synthase